MGNPDGSECLIDVLTLNPERLRKIKIEPIQYQLSFSEQ